MAKRPRQLLGITLADDVLHIAEVRSEGAKVVRQSTLSLAAGLSLDKPDALGKALAEHLKAEQYGTREVAIGLSARWLFARQKTVPTAAAADARAGMLRLAIERDHAAGTPLVFDYLDLPTRGDATTTDVLLLATRQDVLAKLRQVALIAKLKPVAVTSAALAVGAAVKPANVPLLMLHDGNLELATRRAGRTASLTRLTSSNVRLDDAAGGAMLLGAVTRSLTGAGEAVNGTPHGLVVVPTAETDAATTARCFAALDGHFAVTVHPLTDPAVAVAEYVLRDSGDVINLLDSRLRVQTRRKLPSAYRIGAIAGAAVLLLVLIVAGMAWQKSSQLDSLRAQHALIASDASTLQVIRDKTAAAAPWMSQRPAYLQAMQAVTMCFPERGRIWVTNLRLDDDMAGSIQCRTDGKETMLACLKAMEQSPNLTGVQMRDFNEADRAAGIVGFEIVFKYAPPKGKGS
jgi:hypothetical protein